MSVSPSAYFSGKMMHSWPSHCTAILEFHLSRKIIIHYVGICTHVVFPSDLVGPGIRLDAALEVDVVALLDVGGVQAGPEEERRARNI